MRFFACIVLLIIIVVNKNGLLSLQEIVTPFIYFPSESVKNKIICLERTKSVQSLFLFSFFSFFIT